MIHQHWQLSVSLYRQPWKCPWNDKVSHRTGLYLELRSDSDFYGIGEVSPLTGFSQESLSECWLSLKNLLQYKNKRSLPASLVWGIICAQQPYSKFPPSNIPAYPLLHGKHEQILEYLQNWPLEIKIAKLKVARTTIAQDLQIIQKICHRYPELSLRLDANGQWDLSQALLVCKRLPAEHIEYLEQPCSSYQDCLTITQQTDIPIALDESLQTSSYDEHSLYYFRQLIIKPPLLGKQTYRLCHLAKKQNMKVSISSSYETEVGLNHLQKLADDVNDPTPGIDTINTLSQPQQKRLIFTKEYRYNPLKNIVETI
ncbi:MAG: o-succinylbenzoate synthase [Candidatus Celerinatantimonas neptuna]|nr:MAG: o-succinylbenzoate synthase [Candidatus Celerinatantimonas neptuna]